MKQFDEIFSRKAKDAFESYNADHLADAGWNAYVKKYGRQHRLAVVIPLWAKAASVAVLLTVGSVFTYRAINREAGEVAVREVKGEQVEPTAPALNDNVAPVENLIIANASNISGLTTKKSIPAIVSDEPKYYPATAEQHTLTRSDSQKVIEIQKDQNMIQNPVESKLIEEVHEGLQFIPPQEIWLIDEKEGKYRNTTIMTGLSGMMASVDNISSNAQGVSFGFYVEQQITRKIAIRPGLAMAMHNYGIESNSGGSEALGYNAPDLSGLSGSTTSYDANIEVLSMEVPVNIVFTVWERAGSNLFLSTGASTVVYLNQNLTGNFQNTYTRAAVDNSTGEVSYETQTSNVQIKSEQEPFNHVDFFGLANFSAGYTLPFGKTNHLLFEPFVQLPISDLTSLNLRIRYGGLSMKVRF